MRALISDGEKDRREVVRQREQRRAADMAECTVSGQERFLCATRLQKCRTDRRMHFRLGSAQK
jgi:hypothetical protein